MSEQLIIRHSAPTLAGLKCASLFNTHYDKLENLLDEIECFNCRFRKKGVRMVILRHGNGTALIYLYRIEKLEAVLRDPKVQALLQKMGYEDYTIDAVLEVLRAHLSESSEFPHEIGVFLDYPVDDVAAFIEKQGKDYKCVGLWKVYTDVEKAQKTFELFKRCSRIYREKFREGFTMDKLTVAPVHVH